jgi:hypothetical protein
MIYNYLGKGKNNHKITFSEFAAFAREFQLSKNNHQLIVFKMISDN